MTSRTNAHQDQVPTNRSSTAGDAASDKTTDQPKASGPTEHDEPRRKKSSDSLAIGGPLTAAFVGGFLVIENLAGAEHSEGGAVASSSEDELLVEGNRNGEVDNLGGRTLAAETSPISEVAEPDSENPSPAPVEDGAMQIEGEGGNPVPVMPEVAAAGSASPVATGLEEGATITSPNMFNISFEGADAEIGADPYVESELLSRDRQVGTPGDDVLVGTDAHDAISGAEGDDIIRGEGGSDILNGNGGDDQLFGGTGRDQLHGGAGNDRLDAGIDDDFDELKGGSGDDVLIVNGRHDVAYESYGNASNGGEDLLIVGSGLADDLPNGADGFTFAFAENHGVDLPEGSAAARRLVGNNIEHIQLEGSANHDIFADGYDNHLAGNDGNNRIEAGGGDDRVAAGGGSDNLRGGDGDDELIGGAGDDVIEGGRGQDMLYGEAGDDVFVIGLNDSAIDTVFDHEGINRLTLEGVSDQSVEASLLGDDLYVTVDQTPVALVSGYVGHEEALAGIDFGQGLRPIDSLLTNHPDLEGAVNTAEQAAAEAAGDDLLSAHLHLTEPTIVGDPYANQRLDGTAGDDWLSGFDGRDILFGKDGNDILEGGDGVDQLRGGAGDDRYLFSKGERGIDKIDDTEGRNMAELEGFGNADIEGAMLGDDLAVLADGKVLFTVDDFASNDGAFQGVQAGNRFIPTEDLLA